MLVECSVRLAGGMFGGALFDGGMFDYFDVMRMFDGYSGKQAIRLRLPGRQPRTEGAVVKTLF
jgi:hypothetical protein